MLKKLNGMKTYMISINAVLGSVIGMIGGELGVVEGVAAIFGAVGLSTVRHAIGKVEKKEDDIREALKIIKRF